MRKFCRKFYRAYFAVALLLGFDKHVYRVSSRWGGGGVGLKSGRYDAAWDATQMLIEDGYHRCSSCTWATHDGKDCCDIHAEPTVPWNLMQDGSDAFDAMPDGEHHRLFQQA